MKNIISFGALVSAVCLAATVTMLSGCGGGSSTPSTPPVLTSSSSVSVSSAVSSSVESSVMSSAKSSSSISSATTSSGSSAGVPLGGTQIINIENPQKTGETIGSVAKISADGPGFTEVFQIQVTKPSGNFWEGQVAFNSTQNVTKNDVLLAHVWIRKMASTDESGSAFLTVFLEINKSPYTKFISQEISSTGDWQEYFIPVQMPEASATGGIGLKFGFGAGSKTQTIQIGGIELLNYGVSKTVAELPVTRASYAGREADAPWRAEANARIEQFRKGDFKVKITDANDKEVVNAAISVKFKKHDYQFGSVIASNILMGESPDSQKYKNKVLELFNQSGTENDLKWGPWIGEWGNNYNKTQTLAALNWLKDKGFYLRGHVMVWPSRNNSPELIKQYIPADKPNVINPVVKQLILDHIDDIGSATKNVVDEWDVLNEPYDNHDYMDAFGKPVMVDWFNRARQNLPTQKLFINDYSILSAGGRDTAHQNFYADTIQYLVDQGAPIDGIGMQSHFGGTPTAIPVIYSILNRYNTQFPNQVIRSTEFDIKTTDEQLQADFTRDFMTIFFSHPATVGIQMWGFWSKAHWIPEAALYDDNWREKPNAVEWKNLTQKVWWNDFSGVTDANGEFNKRGFYGIYSVDVTINGKTQTFQIHVEKNKSNNHILKLTN